MKKIKIKEENLKEISREINKLPDEISKKDFKQFMIKYIIGIQKQIEKGLYECGIKCFKAGQESKKKENNLIFNEGCNFGQRELIKEFEKMIDFDGSVSTINETDFWKLKEKIVAGG